MEQIPPELIAQENADRMSAHSFDLECLAKQLERRGVDIQKVIGQAERFGVAVPSWGFGQGGTRFGRFPLAGEPRSLREKIYDAGVVNQLAGVTPKISLHIPWDTPASAKEMMRLAASLGLRFDSVNSNTFQDQEGQDLSYKFGSVSHTEEEVRAQAIEHNIECIRIGQALKCKALTVWLGDGGSFPGQQHFRRALERTIASLGEIYAALPADWRVFIEYKPFEPAFYSTVIQDWGSALLIAQALGPKASCLVDLGHHLPNTNIEMIVARLISVNRLGGFHFNDSKYADDDLSSGSIKPYQLFLIFFELVDAAADPGVRKFRPAFDPWHMIDQSHNVKDPIEDLIQSGCELHRAYVKALLVDRSALANYQEDNDVVMAERTLKEAYETDVSVILAEVRRRKKAAIDPLSVFRKSGYRKVAARERV